jgi:hypothetical protein
MPGFLPDPAKAEPLGKIGPHAPPAVRILPDRHGRPVRPDPERYFRPVICLAARSPLGCGRLGTGSGFPVRPMIILIVFGAIQDVIFHAPMGSFEVVNLMTYAASTAISSEFDMSPMNR